MNAQNLAKLFWDFSSDNPEKIKPTHIALFFYAIELCTRLGWKEKFQFSAPLVMNATGIKSYTTFKKTLDELIDDGFIIMIQRSTNQHSENIIQLANFLTSETPIPLDEVVLPTKPIITEIQQDNTAAKIIPIQPPKEEKKKPTTKRFVKPTIEEIEDYFFNKNIQDYKYQADKFFNYYESKGWLVGKSPMKIWKAACNNWISNNSKFNSNNPNQNANTESKIGRTSVSKLQEFRNSMAK